MQPHRRNNSIYWQLALQRFQAWLLKERVPGSHGLSDFVPKGDVEHYLRQDDVLRDILKAIFSEEVGLPNEDAILARYSIVFAILVCIGKPEYIGTFLSHDNLCDSKLPFLERPKHFPVGDPSESQGHDSNQHIFFDKFRERQSRFCAPTLMMGHFHNFGWDDRLPFMEKRSIGEGGSAKVYSVKVHNQHDLLEGKPQESHKTYALKAYEHEDGERCHRIETAMFNKLHCTGLDETHMIGYHCSFLHKGKHYALLEYADVGTLESFMINQANPSTDKEIETFWENLLLVIDAIDRIHELDPDGESIPEAVRFTGVHQDIKPTNILVKTKTNALGLYECTFGLADLGTSSLIRTKSNQSNRDNFGTKSYGSPESFRKDSYHEKRDIRINGKADVWSFACVLSEACIWVMYGSAGPHGVQAYRERRQKHNQEVPRGSDCFHCGGKESQAVLDEHREALRQRRCDPITGAILRAMPKMLHIEQERRPTALQLRDHFKEIISWAKEGADPTATPSLDQTPVRKSSRGTTQSSTHSSPPLGSRWNPRFSKSASHHAGDGEAHSSRNIYDSGQPLTETPRTLTLDGDAHNDISHHAQVVAGASDVLRQHANHAKAVGRGPAGKLDEPRMLPQHIRVDTAGHNNTQRDTPPVSRQPTVFDDQSREVSQPHDTTGRELSPVVHVGDDISPGHPNLGRSPTIIDSSRTPRPSRTPEPSPTPGSSHTPHPPARTPEPPPTPGSSHTPHPPARLLFKDALEWKRRVKAGGRLDTLANYSLLRQLKGRDHVFVVDDCETMGQLRANSRRLQESEVTDYIDVLSYMVKRQDDDGMDLHYFNSSEKILNCKNSSTFVNSVRGKVFAGMSTPEGTLKTRLDEYIAQIKAYAAKLREYESHSKKRFSRGPKPPKPPKPLSVYVFTDGIWESPDDNEGAGYLVETIQELIQALHSAGCRRAQVGIQFIRFGNHPFGMQRLEALDLLGRSEGVDLDIVDTEPIENGNVWKMLLGAINPRFDAD